MSLQIGHLLDKLYTIDKKLGGTAGVKKLSGDEFTNIKDAIVQKFHALRKKMEEKDKKANTADGVRLNVEMKDLMSEIEQLLLKMNETLRKQAKDKKKYPESNIQAKQKMYDNLRQQMADAQTIVDPGHQSFDQIETVTDMKSRLMLEGKGGGRAAPPKEASQEEKAAMERWKQNDQKMDGQLDQIIAGTALWKENAQKIGQVQQQKNIQQIDHTTMQIAKLDKEVDITNKELEKQNKQLKAIVEKYRQPNKFCMDIVLIVVLLGLAGAIYTCIK